MANKQINSDKHIFIDTNDLVLIEIKREYRHHMSNEVRNFIEHSLYFIELYKNLKLLENYAVIHLLFVYDHTRNYNDEGDTVVELYKTINENCEKLKLFPNKIKFYLVHSFPNLTASIFDRLEDNITDLNKQNEKLSSKIEQLENEIRKLKQENEKGSPEEKPNDKVRNQQIEKDENIGKRKIEDDKYNNNSENRDYNKEGRDEEKKKIILKKISII